jgi:uncharacterized protein (TIGR02611 family)
MQERQVLLSHEQISEDVKDSSEPTGDRMSHRHDVWGDDPEERDADEIVAEVLAVEPELTRRWQDHPAVVPFKAVVLFLGHNGKRLVITIAGVVLLVLGLAGVVLPVLPGWLLIFAGLAVLSTEYVWAERLLRRAKKAATAAKDKALAREKARSGAMERGSSEATATTPDD